MSRNIEVILIKEEKSVGKFGQKKKVRPGYARNYLIPQGIALYLTPQNEARFGALAKAEVKRVEKEKTDAEAIKKNIDGKTLEIEAKAKKDGSLYGSVTVTKVVELLNRELEVKIEKEKIEIKEPIKSVGEFDILINLKHNIQSNIKLKVNPQEK